MRRAPVATPAATRAVRLAALLALATPAALCAQAPCDARDGVLASSRDLRCVELWPARGIDGVTARAALERGDGPFTVAVTAAGVPRHRPVLAIAGLPAPATLGPYATYVAWAATPVMHPVVRLGAVTNGTTTLPEVALDKFVLLVTAEASDTVAEPTGRLVLRGQSPSMRLQPPDVMQFALGAVGGGRSAVGTDSSARADARGAHAHHAAPLPPPASRGNGSLRWTHVPMPAGFEMLPAEMALRPNAAPYLPTAQRPTPNAAPRVQPRRVVALNHGDTLRLTAGPVRRTWKGRDFVMFGFNGQHPGPLLRVAQAAEVVVEFTNALDQPSAVHWHGLRHDNASDGVPGLTQDPVPPGGRFTYRLRFPDAGIYWYHPHVRHELQQDLGLAGNILVRSPDAGYWSPADREEVLLLDDLLVGDDGLVPFGGDVATHALMGRFGNVFLVNGEPSWRATAAAGEVVRLHLTNASNTRTFNLSIPGARLKLVGGDVGAMARETWVESVVLAPAERWTVHVRLDSAGSYPLVNRVLALDHLFGRFVAQVDTLGVVRASGVGRRVSGGTWAAFDSLRVNAGVRAELANDARRPTPDTRKHLVLAMEDRGLPWITRQLMSLDSTFFQPVEWSGTMPSMNWAATSDQVRWVLRDAATGQVNMDVRWRFRVGERVALRIANERRSLHAMQHPIHLHGQRFVVTAVDGVATTDPVWKDTVLVPVGSTVDLLVEMTNPGRWMLHCHIAEHMAADMMMSFEVGP